MKIESNLNLKIEMLHNLLEHFIIAPDGTIVQISPKTFDSLVMRRFSGNPCPPAVTSTSQHVVTAEYVFAAFVRPHSRGTAEFGYSIHETIQNRSRSIVISQF